MAHAAAIRRRLKELRDRLGVRLPVYAAVHQGRPDRRLLRVLRRPGPREARAGVGHDLPADSGNRAGRRLRRRLRRPGGTAGRQVLDRMQAERSPDRRALIAGFPAQVASLAAPLRDFLDAAFAGFPAGSGADAARRLSDLRHAGGHADRPADRRRWRVASASTSGARQACGRSMGAATSWRGCCARWCLARRCWFPNRRARRGGGDCVYAGGYAALLLAVLAAAAALWCERCSQPGGYRPVSRRPRLAIEDRVAAAAGSGDGRQPASHRCRCSTQARDLPFRTDAGSGPGLVAGTTSWARPAAPSTATRCARAAAAPGLAAGGPDARRPGPPRLPLPGDARLPDAGRRGPAGPRPGARPGCNSTGSSDIPSAGAARRSGSAIWTRCWRNRCRRSPWTAAWCDAARVTFSRVSVAQRVYSRIVPSAAAQALAPWRPADALGAAGRCCLPGLRQAADRRHPRPLHRVRVPRRAAALGADGRAAGRGRKLGAGQASEIDASPEALGGLQAQVVQLYRGRFRPAVGRVAGRSGDRAASAPRSRPRRRCLCWARRNRRCARC